MAHALHEASVAFAQAPQGIWGRNHGHERALKTWDCKRHSKQPAVGTWAPPCRLGLAA